MSKWWEKPVRMLRVDYAPDFSAIRHEDMAALAASRKKDWEINCEWIVGTPGWAGGGHNTTFVAEGYEQCAGFDGFDYLRTYTPHAHKEGIRVIAYLNMHWYSYEFADLHNDWEQKKADGKRRGPLYGNGATFCVNTAWRDWAFRLIRAAMKTGIDGVFLDGPVVFPGCCYCPACQQKFQNQYGRPIPAENWEDPFWKKFLDFREDSLASFLRDAQRAALEQNPEGVIFLNAGSWHPGSGTARDIQKTGPWQNFNGAEAFFHYDRTHQNIYAWLMTGKYLRAGDKPAVVFTHYMNGAWHFLNLPPGELNLALAQTAATGANLWLALLRPALKSQPESHRPVRDIFRFMSTHEEYFTGLEPMADTALLFSSRTGKLYLSRQDGLYDQASASREEDLGVSQEQKHTAEWNARKRRCEELLTESYCGYFHALTRGHVLFNILLDQDLRPEKLKKYKTLILPDAACLSAEVSKTIMDYVKNGGAVVASFEAGFYDEQGLPAPGLRELFGIQETCGMFPVRWGDNYSQTARDYAGFKPGALVERGAYALQVKAANGTDTPAFFLEPTEGVYRSLKGVSSWPAMIIRKYGRGQVIYYPEALGQFYWKSGMLSAEARLLYAARTSIGKPEIEINAPCTVSAEAYRQTTPDRVLIHLVNNTVDGRPVAEFIPAGNICIRMQSSKPPKEIITLRENGPLSWTYENETIKISLAKLELYEIVVIKMAP